MKALAGNLIMDDRAHFKADLVLLAVTLLAALGWIFSKESLKELPPLLFIGIRFLCAGTILFVTYRQAWKQLAQSKIRNKIFLNGLVMALGLLCWIQGLANGKHMGEGAFITVLGVVFVPLIVWLFYREPVARSTWLAIPVAISGLAFLSLDGGFVADPGQVWFYLATMLFALQFTFVSRLGRWISPVPLTAAQLVVVGIVGLLVSALTEEWPAAISAGLAGWLVASIVLGTSLRFSLQTYGQSLAPASHAALIMIMEPVWTALAAAIWFGETMVASQVLGCSLIFSALLVSRWRLFVQLARVQK